MKKNDPIKSIMSDELKFARPDQSFSSVKSMMEEFKIHHVPVVEGESIVGIISRLDILKYSHSQEYIRDGNIDGDLDKFVKIDKLMTKNPVTLKSTDTIKHAVEILINNSFNSIPVVEGDGQKLVGIITTKDIMTYLIHQY